MAVLAVDEQHSKACWFRAVCKSWRLADAELVGRAGLKGLLGLLELAGSTNNYIFIILYLGKLCGKLGKFSFWINLRLSCSINYII